ncbi:efflux RND transporter periplasmic adaptor subunit [Hallella mizrahii]|uniref:Efflux RND transporter periplasmic adaptor subunit n=1 Tax=Hallella mizrahii TaxID=2606637 RepID=A0A7K0KD41_9BACT|nr:efflux RND transporter periplasmic adaptor subunit [Hallella mizrahii]MST83768.1 efflux RND transporter periplasmic adaptor subunit [Hallella mizrahii]
MKKIKISKVWILVAIVVVLAVVAFLLSGNKKKEQVQFNTAEVAPANIVNTVSATGTIEPVTSVTVGTQVSGIVSKLYVDYNSVVKKGQVIAELDKSNLTSELNSAKASLEQSKASLASAESSLSYQTANFRRNKALYQKGLISGNDYESARLSYQTALANVSSARDQVASAQEQVKKAQTNLSYATITSPIDGIVLSKSVEEGQTVAASFSTPTLFTIAKDLTNMQVVADVDEADIGNVKVGERVTFTVDAYPDNTFSGTVKQVRQEATTTNNVVTYSVVITAPNADLKLKPGLTATVTIYTQENKGVLSVPSKALRFTPEKETVGGMKIKDIANAKNKVWTIEGNTVVAHRVNIGMTDGSHTQILSGIRRGAKVITGISSATSDDDGDDNTTSSSESSPFAPKGPGSKKK